MNTASAAGDLIETGDRLFVRQRASAQSSDVVVAFIDGEPTVKQLVTARAYWVLPQPSDPEHKPIVVGDHFRVLGTVTKILEKGSALLRAVFAEEGPSESLT
jgi:SOS-response transcriptional repressor LexA